MKIIDIVTYLMRIPNTEGTSTRRNWIFVEVRTDEGISGIGEATTEWSERAVVAQIESEIKPRLLGMDPTDVERIWQLGYRDFWWRQGIVHTSAISGIDQALWDIAGKVAGQPVFKLLGGKVREKVRTYARLCDDPAVIKQAAHNALDCGFDAIKSGRETICEPYSDQRQVELEVELFHELREVVGPDVDLMIDAGSMFSPPVAHHLIEGLLPFKLLFIEEPTNQDTIEPTLRLKQNFPTQRIALGERWMTRWDFRLWFEKQAIDVCQADICHTGGISELMKIAHYAEVYGIMMAPHNPYGPVAMAAAVHASAAMQNFLILEYCRLQPWFDQIQKVRLPIDRGAIDINELGKHPGLGVELDLERIAALAGHTPISPRRYLQVDGSTPLL